MVDDCDSCQFCGTRPSGVFADASEAGLERLSAARVARTFRRGEVLFHQGSRPTGVYCVRSGEAKLYSVSDGGGIQILRWAGPGALLGETALYADQPHGTTAEASTDMQVCFIDRDALGSLLVEEPGIACRLIRKLSRELCHAEEQLLGVSHKSVRQRVAEMVLGLPAEASMSRREMAQSLGTTPETLARVLTEFHRDGLIERSRRRIRILDRERLAELDRGQ